MDPLQIKTATDELIKAFPNWEADAAEIVATFTAAAQQVATNATTALADGLSQIVGIGLAIDGATIEFEIESIVIPAIKAKLTVHMPLKPSA